MEDALNSLPDAAEPSIQAGNILAVLIGAAGCPNQVIGLVKDLSLPLQSQEAFVAKEITEREVIYDGFCR